MDARITTAALVAASLLSLGASHRTQNFIVTTSTAQLAREICEKAEADRRKLSLEWLGHELPNWQQPCPIRAHVGPQLGAGGATSFMFDRGRPFGWTMTIQGSRQRLLDSVLPHEVTHTIFATHFGRPLPRWADEGACTTVEHQSERSKQEQLLLRFLSSKPSRGIAFNNMFAMTEYPRDVLPLYAQGFSLARYLIAQGGKRKYVDYVGDGMKTNNWPAMTRKYYGFRDLSELQVTWLDWVSKGSPMEMAGSRRHEQLASARQQSGHWCVSRLRTAASAIVIRQIRSNLTRTAVASAAVTAVGGAASTNAAAAGPVEQTGESGSWYLPSTSIGGARDESIRSAISFGSTCRSATPPGTPGSILQRGVQCFC